ncbi:hypothetical protein ACH4TP_33780 [Streptomyces sp. NPDC021012]|uniref:hypothetical protein n=1 Tax=Streptomyces sp. NPDC021012 TaxID=3365107 RepID=UPI0037A6A1CD
MATALLAMAVKIRSRGMIARGLEILDDEEIGLLFEGVARSGDPRLATDFAEHVAHGDSPSLLHRFLDTMNRHGALDLVDVTASEKLNGLVTAWRRRSRGQ